VYSVLILTLNEERNLPVCLASLRTCNDIVVLDSGSTDATVRLAKDAGARVFVRAFDNFAAQRNYAQHNIPFRNNWVFHLDADERFTPELDAACRNAEPKGIDGYYVAPRMLWKGRWIPHCTDYPAWQARFVRAPNFRFIEVGHGQREDPAMKMGFLRAGYIHELSASGAAEWLAKHERYARAEALAYYRDANKRRPRDLVSGDRLARRRALKHFSYRLPLRPALRFVYQYILRRGFLDGREGLEYCRLLARYEGFAARELQRLRRSG
jgi:glycosyltransferase involved in cell wall biosynthesis